IKKTKKKKKKKKSTPPPPPPPPPKSLPFQKNKLFHFYGKTSSMHASLIFKKDRFFVFSGTYMK
ncbi:hypothetical protein O6V12_11000, partial [Salmonella enterica subsp. enterica]